MLSHERERTLIVADKKQPIDVSKIGNPIIHQAFKYFCRHLVSLVCRCDPIDATGKPAGPPEFFGLSGQVLSIRGAWFLLTAGHIIKGVEDRLASGRYALSFYLVDDLGPNVVDHNIIQFEYQDSLKWYWDEDGVDVGLVSLRPYYRSLLQANGIEPISEEHWRNQSNVECNRHLMLGFPTELIGMDIKQTPQGYRLTGSISPAMIFVTKLDDPPPDAASVGNPRFVGQIGAHVIADIDGMSGGPIFGIEKGREDRYWTVAVQHSWLPSKRVIFGTPVSFIGKFIDEVVSEAEGEEGDNE